MYWAIEARPTWKANSRGSAERKISRRVREPGQTPRETPQIPLLGVLRNLGVLGEIALLIQARTNPAETPYSNGTLRYSRILRIAMALNAPPAIT
jgi:hypothetical protein